ncbi:hypothetical protein FRC12_010030 [Ceratobasidium sp. 428]|nr:hypothetical protein FRC12_010030 [Ceratobasidium sp. 428]
MDIPRVCTRWNRIATNTPSLWSHVDINPSDYFFAAALKRAQIQLKYCRSMPVQLHLYDMSGIDRNSGQEILEVIQSRGGRLGSLIVTNIWYNSSVQAFLGSMVSHTMSNSLRTLLIHGAQDGSGQRTIDSLPVTSLCGLTVLDLWDLSRNIHPSVDGIVELLPHCSALHTLRLRFLEFSPDLLQSHQIVSLPQLRFLEILGVNRTAVLSLLSKLNSGGLELDVRLKVEYIGADGLDSPGQLFLARSNVVSLSINRSTDRNFIQRPVTDFTFVPRLRMLQLDSVRLAQDLALVLETTVDDRLSFQLPYLQCLCLVEWSIGPQAITLIEQILRRKKLRHLAFRDCRYLSDFTRNDDGNKESDPISGYDSDVGFYNYQKKMPQRMRDWLLERVGGVVVVEEYDDDRVYHGVDLFVQNLIILE